MDGDGQYGERAAAQDGGRLWQEEQTSRPEQEKTLEDTGPAAEGCFHPPGGTGLADVTLIRTEERRI